MKITTWNLWCNNKNQILSFQLLTQQINPDLICLQEVSLETLNYLKKLENYSLVHAKDLYTYKKNVKKYYYLVIIWKKNVITPLSSINFEVEHLTRRSLIDKFLKWGESLEFQYFNFEYNSIKFRLFNIHLEVAAGPNLRVSQFHEIVKYFSYEAENIVVGDFNTYAHPYLNWLIGYFMGFKDSEYKINEKKVFQSIFDKLKLNNILRGKITYPKYRMQLDYALISKKIKINELMVGPSLFGSDHYPCSFEIFK